MIRRVKKLLHRYLLAEAQTAAHVRRLRAREESLERTWKGKFLYPNGWRAKRYARLKYRRQSVQRFFHKNWPESWRLI